MGPRVRRVVVSLGLASLWLGPVAGLAQPASSPDSPAPLARFTAAEFDIVNHLDTITKRRVPYRLNLADEKQHAYVLAMLRLHGDSPDKSPQLYKTLAEAHRSGTPGPPTVALDDPANIGAIVPINIVQYVWDNGTVANSSLLSSVPGGTTSTTMMINFRLLGQQPFAVSPTFEQSGQGQQFMQNYGAPLPAPSATSQVLASSLILTTVGSATTAYTMALDEGDNNATSICVTAPNYGSQQQPPVSCPPVGAACVNNGPVSTPIMSCYGRAAANCNYAWGGSGYPPQLAITVAGSVTFPSPIDPALSGQFILNLQAQEGGCYLPPNGGQPAALSPTYFQISNTNPNTLNFCFSGQQMANVNCLTQAFADVYLDLSIYALLDVQGSGSNYGMATISSNASLDPHQSWFALMPSITVQQGCFAPGTQITLADGTTRAIEQFKGDGTETVRADAAGRQEKVTGTGDGTEAKPLIRLTDSAGHSVLLTETHPVITGRGPKIASSVRVGDTLTTIKGPSRVKKIDTVPAVKGQKVHNLFVGERADAAAGRATLFANGILVGDMHMQGELFRQTLTKSPSREEILARLPKAWHRDYLNSLKYGTNRP